MTKGQYEDVEGINSVALIQQEQEKWKCFVKHFGVHGFLPKVFELHFISVKYIHETHLNRYMLAANRL